MPPHAAGHMSGMLTRRATLSGLFWAPLMPLPQLVVEESTWAKRLVHAARQQIGVTRIYDPAYVRLSFPLGDVPRERGVCTDVVVRAFRDAFAFDLQSEVHIDMQSAFAAYPSNWGLTRPDTNIDHRRVPNLERYFERKGAALDTPRSLSDWTAGDLCTMRLGGNLPHIGIVSDRTGIGGEPLVIQNIGAGAREEPLLGRYDRERRFRFEPPGGA